MNKEKRSMDESLVHTHLNNGMPVVLRAITPEDGDLLREGIERLSSESRYFRFFSSAPSVPTAVLDQLIDVDRVNHLAWGALSTNEADAPVMGVVHAVRYKDNRVSGEYSVAILDDFHGQGVARILTAALLLESRANGITQLDVHILSENRAAKALIRSLGAQHRDTDSGVNDYLLNVEVALAALKKDEGAPGLKQVFAQLEG